MRRIKTLIHLHTDYSYDSNIGLDDLARFIEKEGFGCVAVTDHDTIAGAQRLRSMTDAEVIVGEEVTTRHGHLIGLFLEQRIRPGMSAADTARAIREQGGLVLVPHPFVTAFSCGLGEHAWTIADSIDAVEVFNAQNLRRTADRKAHELAEALGVARFVGADSHAVNSIAPAYQVMADFSGPASFLAALADAQWFARRHPAAYFAAAGYRTIRHLMGWPLPATFGANYAGDDRRAAANEPPAATVRIPA